MLKVNNERKVTGLYFSVIALFLSVISEKWGLQRTKVPETISWHEFFSERIDTVILFTFSGFIIGYIFHHKIFIEKKYLICKKCQAVYEINSISECTKCNEKLEPLEGFYKRNPHLKESE